MTTKWVAHITVHPDMRNDEPAFQSHIEYVTAENKSAAALAGYQIIDDVPKQRSELLMIHHKDDDEESITLTKQMAEFANIEFKPQALKVFLEWEAEKL